MNKTLVHDLGRFISWLPQIFSRPENFTMYYKETIRQMYDIGIGSFPIVFIISLFIGAVTAVQISYQLAGTLIPPFYIGYIVRDMMIIELSSTFTCLVLAGKVGSTMAAEIGGMRQKEHIDAMEIMGVNTSAYLVMPKIIAALIIVPVLVSVSAVVGVGGGYFAAVEVSGFSDAEFTRGLRSFFVPLYVNMMYIKSVVFAFILVAVACYQGYFVTGGSVELGKASTRAVVFGDILILVADLLIAVVFMTA